MKKIVIVGAGPTGLCAALSLARAGIPSTILDAKPQWECVGSRAIVIDHGSLCHFRDIGCLDDILCEGLVAKGRRMVRNLILRGSRRLNRPAFQAALMVMSHIRFQHWKRVKKEKGIEDVLAYLEKTRQFLD